jgi:hypothetical protein
MNTRFKVFASYNILQYLCDFIHVLIFVIVSKCRKSLNLTDIVITIELCGSVDTMAWCIEACKKFMITICLTLIWLAVAHADPTNLL